MNVLIKAFCRFSLTGTSSRSFAILLNGKFINFPKTFFHISVPVKNISIHCFSCFHREELCSMQRRMEGSGTGIYRQNLHRNTIFKDKNLWGNQIEYCCWGSFVNFVGSHLRRFLRDKMKFVFNQKLLKSNLEKSLPPNMSIHSFEQQLILYVCGEKKGIPKNISRCIKFMLPFITIESNREEIE